MFCSHCGSSIDENAVYCGHCGASLVSGASTPTSASSSSVPFICPYACQGALASEAAAQARPKTFFVWNCLATGFFFWPLGLVGIFFSLRARRAIALGRISQAYSDSYKAQNCFWATLLIGVIMAMFVEALQIALSFDVLQAWLVGHFGDWVLVLNR